MKRSYILSIIFLCFIPVLPAQSNYRLMSSERMLIDERYDAQSDAGLRRYLAPYQAHLDRELHTVLANAAEELTADDPCGALNYWVVDLMLRQMKTLAGEAIDMAVVNNHAFRKPLPEGPITLFDVYETLPFDNEIVILKMQASDLMSLMKTIARRGTESFANACIEVKNGRLESLQIAGHEWNPNRIYTVVTIDYLAQGSGGMTAFRKAKEAVYTDIYLRDLIVKEMEKYSREGRLLRAHVDERFTLLP